MMSCTSSIMCWAVRRTARVQSSNITWGVALDQLIADTLAGSVAHVWPFFGEARWQDKTFTANIVREANRVKVSVLAPGPIGSVLDTIPEHDHMPDSLLAVSEVHGTLLFDV